MHDSRPYLLDHRVDAVQQWGWAVPQMVSASQTCCRMVTRVQQMSCLARTYRGVMLADEAVFCSTGTCTAFVMSESGTGATARRPCGHMESQTDSVGALNASRWTSCCRNRRLGAVHRSDLTPAPTIWEGDEHSTSCGHLGQGGIDARGQGVDVGAIRGGDSGIIVHLGSHIAGGIPQSRQQVVDLRVPMHVSMQADSLLERQAEGADDLLIM